MGDCQVVFVSINEKPGLKPISENELLFRNAEALLPLLKQGLPPNLVAPLAEVGGFDQAGAC
jgi:hypothetical protein